MIYDLNIPFEKDSAKERFKWLMDKGKKIELKEKRPKRSVSQNAYLHLILSWFGLEFGYNLEEVKQKIFKEIVNPELFYEGEVGKLEKIQRWRSTSDLDTKEMTLAIDRFRDYSAENGYYLPSPDDMVALEYIENEINKHNSKQYL